MDQSSKRKNIILEFKEIKLICIQTVKAKNDLEGQGDYRNDQTAFPWEYFKSIFHWGMVIWSWENRMFVLERFSRSFIEKIR